MVRGPVRADESAPVKGKDDVEMLHRLDTQRLDWIAVERPPETPEWAGVLDRLRRAAR